MLCQKRPAVQIEFGTSLSFEKWSWNTNGSWKEFCDAFIALWGIFSLRTFSKSAMRITWQNQCILYYRKLQATLNTFNVEALNRFMPFTGEECSLETFLPRPFYAHMNSLRRLSVYILLKNFQVFLSRERIICLILFSKCFS